MTVLAEYGQRGNTRREHAALIRQHYPVSVNLPAPTFRLTRLLYTRSWISNERLACFSIWRQGGLCNIRIILPGATTLTRLISEVREKATLRLWNKLALIPSSRTAFTAGDAAGANWLQPPVFTGITEKGPCDHQWSGV
ncbi:DUF4158 domain-containing protein [Klebsiella pneumoniae]|uniref:DUF4158 domain-containing protein n=1 Tax=Klebsiella pneumoniae TaxID=573 RepID=UPI0038903E0A